MKECKFQKSLNIITREFKECKKVLLAIGDDTRQAIIIALLESDCNGIRVGEITKKTHLSRPAVSHHLKILKESGIINMRRECEKVSSLVNHIYDVVKEFEPIDKRQVDE